MKVQFVSPHPDDLELYCGGALLAHSHEGDQIQILGVTRGERGCLRVLRPLLADRTRCARSREMEQRAALLDGAELVWLDVPDGRVSTMPDAKGRFARAIATFEPDMVYLPETRPPDSMRRHPDHEGSSLLVQDAVRSLNRPVVLRHYHTLRPNRWVDVGAYYAASLHALRIHRNQYSIVAYPPCLLHVLERWRRRWLLEGGAASQCKYAESFYEVVLEPSAQSGI